MTPGKSRTTDLRTWLRGAALRGSVEHSFPHSRAGRSVVRGKSDMTGFFPALWAVGVTLDSVLEQARDPFLITGALVLIILPLSYLASSRVRRAMDTQLAVRRPTTLKRWLGGLLIFFPGTVILTTTYYPEITRAVEQRWPNLGAHLKRQGLITSAKAPIVAKETQGALRKAVSSKSRSHNKESVASITKGEGARNRIEAEKPEASARAKQLREKRKRATRKSALAKKRPPIKTTRRSNPNSWITKGGQIAAPSADVLDTAAKYLADKDLDSLQGLEADKRVILLKEGLRVYIVKYEYSSGKVKIRLHGSNVELWTFREALTKG